MSKKPYTSLTFEKRQIIENMAKKKQTPQRIAEATGVHVATIYREMKRGQTRERQSILNRRRSSPLKKRPERWPVSTT